MRHLRKRLCWLKSVLVLFTWISSASVLNAQGIDIEAAKKDGRVVVYGVVPPKTIKPIIEPFERKYGIRVEYWRASTTKVLDRVLTEWRTGRSEVDVVEGNRGTQLILAKEGVFANYMPPSAAEFPQRFLEKENPLIPWRINPFSIVFNTELVTKEEVPRSFQDLLLPRWKGKVSIPDPSAHTTSAQFLVDMGNKYGIDWRDFAKRLAKNEPFLVSGFVEVVNAVIRGESQVGITYLKYVGQYRAPVDFTRLNMYLADVNYLGLSKKSRYRNAGMLYMEYLCSLEGQQAVAKAGEFVVHPKAHPNFKGAEQVSERTVFVDVPTAEEFKKLKEEFRQIFFGK